MYKTSFISVSYTHLDVYKRQQEHSTTELGILRGELNKQVTKISEVQESMILKIAEVKICLEC